MDFSRWGSAPSAMSLRTSARTPVRGRGRVVRRGARGGTSGWAIGSRVVPATAVPEELVNQVSVLIMFGNLFSFALYKGGQYILLY